ncbi:MAG: STAS domain-containing protein [Planctomycetaceae bacterium]
MEGFRLLTVRHDGNAVTAVLPYRHFLGQEYREGLKHDYRQLTQLGSAAVRLDLRAVEHIDGAFAGLLVQLARGLADGGGRLTVEASPSLAELFRITRLDRLFEVLVGPGDTRTAGPAEPNAAADRGA